MLAKGDLKFRLKGKRLNGDFALVHIKARRAGSKGNEWLLIKKKDDHVVAGFDIDAYDKSILTDRTMAEIAGDKGSAEWKSSRLHRAESEGSLAGGCNRTRRREEEGFNREGRGGRGEK